MKLVGIILPVILLIVIIVGGYWKSSSYSQAQVGGEYISYISLEPENSMRHNPLGYLSDSDGFIPPSQIRPVLHATPLRMQPHDVVFTNGRDVRTQNCLNYLSKDEVDYRPYDFSPFEWRPFWLRRADRCPSARTCSEYANDNCIGQGDSDYQSCYDREYAKCPAELRSAMAPLGEGSSPINS